jgi:hypothetical protein
MDSSAHTTTVDLEISNVNGNENYIAADSEIDNINYVAVDL